MKRNPTSYALSALSGAAALALTLSACSSGPAPVAYEDPANLAVSTSTSDTPTTLPVSVPSTTLPEPTTTLPETTTAPTTATPTTLAPTTTVKKPATSTTTAPKTTTTTTKAPSTTTAPAQPGLTAAQIIDALRSPLAKALREYDMTMGGGSLLTDVKSFENKYAEYGLQIYWQDTSRPRLTIMGQTYCFRSSGSGITLYDIAC